MVGDTKTIDINPLIIFHQNIYGLRKTDELINSVFLNFLHTRCGNKETGFML
jgi:hypothetical protein